MRRLVIFAMVGGCMDSPTPAPVQTKTEAAPVVEEAKVEEKAPAIPELSEEDKRLIAADPKDLTPEERRERAYALRRKVMQNPDSPAARSLRDMEEAIRKGEITPELPNKKKEYPTLSLPGTTPTEGRPPAGHRPAEDAKKEE